MNKEVEPASQEQISRSAGWMAIATYGNVVMSFVVFLVLTRLLSPSEFGLVALASAFIDVLLVAARGGLPDVIVQKKDMDEDYASTAFVISTISGILFAVAFALASAPISSWFALPELYPLLVALSLTFVFGGLAGIHEGRLQRTFGFKRIALRSLGANLLAGSVAIAAALAGYGAWSLVLQRLLTAFATMLLNWYSYPWMPRLVLVGRYAAEQLKLGVKIFGNNLLIVLNLRVHELIAGVLASVEAVAYIRLAWRCIDLVSQFAVIPFTTVGLASYARAVQAGTPTAQPFIQLTGTSAAIAFPCFVGLAAVAPSVVPLAFGSHWAPAVPIVQLLCLLAVPFVVNSFLWPLLIATQRTVVGLKLTFLQLLVGIAMSLVAAPFGAIAIAATYVLRAHALFPLSIRILSQGGIGGKSLRNVVVGPLVTAVIMGSVVAVLHIAMLKALGPATTLAVSTVIGIVLYVGLIHIVSPDTVVMAKQQIAAIFFRRRNS